MESVVDNFVLKETCGACPEAYDIYLNGYYVGYLRLRHGSFRAVMETGETVYQANPKGDGMFEPDERDSYIRTALNEVSKKLSAVD